MSSFVTPHHLYLFSMTNGKKKMAYGASPEDAYAILKMRLTDSELSRVIRDQCVRINQRELRQHIHELG